MRRKTVREHDTAVLARDPRQHGPKRGDVGAVVMVRGEGEAFDAEFAALDRDTVALGTLTPADVRRGTHEIPHARAIA